MAMFVQAVFCQRCEQPMCANAERCRHCGGPNRARIVEQRLQLCTCLFALVVLLATAVIAR